MDLLLQVPTLFVVQVGGRYLDLLRSAEFSLTKIRDKL